MPACRQGILAGTVLAFARALGEYGATSMLIGYIPKGKNDDLSVLLANLLEKDSLSTDEELQKFKRCCRKESRDRLRKERDYLP